MDKRCNQEVLMAPSQQFNSLSRSQSSSSLCVIDRLFEIENAMREYVKAMREYQSIALQMDLNAKTLNKDIDDLIIDFRKEIGEKLTVIVNESEYQKKFLMGRALRSRDELKTILKDNKDLRDQIASLTSKVSSMEKELHLNNIK